MYEPLRLMTIEELKSASTEDFFKILGEQKVLEFIGCLGNRFNLRSVSDLQKYHPAFYNDVCVIESHSPYTSDQEYALVNKEGHIIPNDCSYFTDIRYLNDQCILATTALADPEFGEIRQYVFNSKGKIIFEGDLGDLSQAFYSRGNIFLVGSRFSGREFRRIRDYRITNSFIHSSAVCPLCRQEIDWDEESGDFYCARCDRHYGDMLTTDVQMQMADYYEDILSSDQVFISEEDRDYYEDRAEFFYLEEIGEDFLGDMYALFSVIKNKMVIPYQPCRIKYVDYYNMSGIYLENTKRRWISIDKNESFGYGPIEYWGYSKDESVPIDGIMSSDVKYSRTISLESTVIPPYSEICYNGNVFTSLIDTFRSGPFVGQTLSLVFKHHFKRLARMFFNKQIYITRTALMQLHQKYYQKHPKRVMSMVYYHDSFFTFNAVSSLDESLRIHNGGGVLYMDCNNEECYDFPFFYDYSFEELLKHHPHYIINLILHDSIDLDNSLISLLDKGAPYYDGIMNALEKQREEKEERRREEYQHYCEQLENSYNYEEDTFYALGGDDYQRFKENGGSIDDMMDGMGL